MYRSLLSEPNLRLVAAAAMTCGSFVAGVTGTNAQTEEDFFHLGVVEYEISCLPCHGIAGRGDGPRAKFLDTQPTDLTGITEATGGDFPVERLQMIIDGRAWVADHGPRAMPLWGERYSSLAREAGIEDAEQGVEMRIDALVQYIESLQER